MGGGLLYDTGTIPKSNIKIVERSKVNTTNTQVHICEIPGLKNGGVKLVNSLHSFQWRLFVNKFYRPRPPIILIRK